MKKLILTIIVALAGFFTVQAQCFVRISSGEQHTMAIADDGTLWGWGANTSGECGVTPSQNLLVPTQVGSFADWIDVDCGPYHTIALRSNGDVYTMGYNNYGQCGTGNASNVLTPALVTSDVINVAAGKGYTSYLIKSDSTLWACGQNNGRFGNNTMISSLSFVQVSSATNWVDIAGGLDHSIALNSLGELYVSGLNTYGQLGQGNYSNSNIRLLVNTGGNPPLISSYGSISGGDNFSVYLDNFGQVHTCGINANGRLGIANNGIPSMTTFYPLSLQNMTCIKAGYRGAMAWNDTSFYAWGKNDYSIMTTTEDAYAPVLAGYTDIPIDASLGLFNIAVISDGEGVYNWGKNDRGNCGDGTTTDRTVPQLNNATCGIASCAITNVFVDDVSACEPIDDTYTVDLTITYDNPPTSGFLNIYGQNTNITGSPQSVTINGLPADGNFVTADIYFTEENTCFGSASWTAPAPCSTTGINDVTQSSILNIYPNPTNSTLNIEVEENTNIKIVSLLGETVTTQQLYTGNNSIDVSVLTSGVYFLRTENGSATKFVKE